MDASLTWLPRLRWAVAAAQLVLAGLVALGFAPSWPLGPVVVVLAVGVASNLVLAQWLRRAPRPAQGVLATVVLLDTVLLTAILFATGGASSPFSPLYLVPVLTGALTLRPSLTWLAVGATGLEYASLFALGPPPPHHHGPQEMQAHVVGMFVTYAFTAPLLAGAVGRIQEARAEAAHREAQARESQTRSEHLASLATLAAGASHELASPLSTIMLVARELERGAQDEAVREDLALVRDEVLRCQDVLSQLSADTGAGMGEGRTPTSIGELVREVLDYGGHFQPVEVHLGVPADARAELPVRMLTLALRRLLGNARAASEPGAPLELSISEEPGGLALAVIDRGTGMAPEVLARATEPFFSTKPEGTGLGLFFVQAIARQHGGSLELASAPGEGTTATLHFPASPLEVL